MSLLDQNFLEQDGTPVPGRIAAQVVVAEGRTLTAAQHAAVTAEYNQFCTQKRLSLMRSQTRTVTLGDGTIVRMDSMGPSDRVFVDPPVGGSSGSDLFVAYPYFVDLAFAPIFDRPTLVDGAGVNGPDAPKEPVYPGFGTPPTPPSSIRPEYTLTYSWARDAAEYSGGASVTTNFGFSWSGSLPGMSPIFSRVPHYFSYIDNSGQRVAIVRLDTNWASAEDAAASGHGSSFPGGQTYSANINVGEMGGIHYESNASPTLSLVTTAQRSPTPAEQAEAEKFLTDIGDAIKANINDPYAAAVDAYNVALATYNAAAAADYAHWLATVYQAWLDALDAASRWGLKAGDTSLVPFRALARPGQLTRLNDWLDTGAADPHLTSRIFTLPYCVAYQIAKPYTLDPGSFVSTLGDSDPVTGEVSTVTYRLGNATREATATDDTITTGVSSVTLRPLDPFTSATPHVLKNELVDPACLFGYAASGTYTRQFGSYRGGGGVPDYPPQATVAVGFSAVSAYLDSLNTGLARTIATGVRPATDTFFPTNTRLTLVQLEWETFDPFTEDWVWMSDINMRRVSPIWLKGIPAPYVDNNIPEVQSAGISPRTVRIRRIVQQVRQRDGSWTTAVDVPASNLDAAGKWSAPVTAEWLHIGPEYPVGVAVLSRFNPLGVPTDEFTQGRYGEAGVSAALLRAGHVALGWTDNELGTAYTGLTTEILRVLRVIRIPKAAPK